MPLLLAVGCGGPDTLHYRVANPQLVTVLVDGKPSIPPATPSEPTATDPTTYDSIVRTGDDTLSASSFTVERSNSGLYGRWKTGLYLTSGEMFELVGPDGWVHELPIGAQPHRFQDGLVFDVVPRLAYWSSRRHGGYASHLGTDVQPGEHVITLSTPRSNLVAAEQRGDRERIIYGLAALLPGVIYSAAGTGLLATSGHSTSGKVVGSLFATLGVSLDVTAIYELVRGARRKTLHP